MRPFSLLSTRFAPWTVGFGLVLFGCFDVETVDVHGEGARPPPRLIDDFDDDADNSVRQPTDASFEPWRCFGYNGRVQIVRCDAAGGVDDRHRLLTYDLFDVPNGKRDYQGAELQAHAREAVDFSAYERFVFSATFAPAPDSTPEPDRIHVQIRLYCGGLDGEEFFDEPVLESRVLWVRADQDWDTFAPLAADLRQPQWQKDQWQIERRALLDPRSCLEQVDAIGFQLQPDLRDGAHAKGTLGVDDIYVE